MCRSHKLALYLSLAIGSYEARVTQAATAGSEVPPQMNLARAYGELPLTFEANVGQVTSPVRFISRGAGYTLFLTPSEAVLRLVGSHDKTAIVRMSAEGGNGDPCLIGTDRQETRSSHFHGNDPRQWHVGAPHFGGVRYESVYPGIDLVYHGNQRQLEYDFIVAPGADPGRIRLAFAGAHGIAIGEHGELILQVDGGRLVQHPPEVYQDFGGRRERIEGQYVLLPRPSTASAQGAAVGPHVGFRVGPYDPTRPLVIDPIIVYSTFLGGVAADDARALAIDGAGNAYVTGPTASVAFPGVSGSSIQPDLSKDGWDSFVTKINAAGTAILYSTYFGGDGEDIATGIAVDSQGNAYVTGYTKSSMLPGIKPSAIQPKRADPVFDFGFGGMDAFVTKINPDGSAIIYTTFLGGKGDDRANAIAVDGEGNAFVTGSTNAYNFPGVSGSPIQPNKASADYPDAFVTKINSDGTGILYSTYLGGEKGDLGNGIALDASGNAYVCGSTESSGFVGVTPGSIQPSPGGHRDGFVTKIDALGTAILYSTFLGGNDDDWANAIALDAKGNAYVAGTTRSAWFPGVVVGPGGSIQQSLAGPGTMDAFVTKINNAGASIVYSTFLGGTKFEEATSIAADPQGNAYVAGHTSSLDFPVAGSAIQASLDGLEDAFVTKIHRSGLAIVYSTFLGGSSFDEAHGIAVDFYGNAYVTGITFSPGFPGVTGSSLQPTHGGGVNDAFVIKLGVTPL